MRYSYEYKGKCIEIYRKGIWSDTPEGVSAKSFHNNIRLWVRIEEANGPEALKHKNFNKEWFAEDRFTLVARVLAGESSVSVDAGITDSMADRMLHQWVRKYNLMGYNGLVSCKKG